MGVFSEREPPRARKDEAAIRHRAEPLIENCVVERCPKRVIPAGVARDGPRQFGITGKKLDGTQPESILLIASATLTFNWTQTKLAEGK